MRLEDFDYHLDESLIAQHPIEPRDEARLLVVDRRTHRFGHHRIRQLPALLNPGDLLVLNNTRVYPARLLGRKRPSLGKIELLLVRPLTHPLSPQAGREVGFDTLSPGVPVALQLQWVDQRGKGEGEIWEAMVRGKVRAGQKLELPDGIIATVMAAEKGRCTVAFPPHMDVEQYAEKHGLVPLPPYIRRPADDADRARYQTIFATRPGAVAAPTAGLHFTDALLSALASAGVHTSMVTLHVGPGTFTPVTCPDIRDHTMEPEWYECLEGTASAVNETRLLGARIIAVGSTSVRVLETAASQGARVKAGTGETNLFIYPGYEFRVVDGMLTNFHLPKSTLFMMVCAFAGRELMLEAYRLAATEHYRFYSYGDAMLIL